MAASAIACYSLLLLISNSQDLIFLFFYFSVWGKGKLSCSTESDSIRTENYFLEENLART